MNKIRFVLPPPNVTGRLHIGHALNISLQDIKARWYKSKGYEIEWIPGTDHAGIATQLIAERALKNEGKTKNDLTHDEFIKYIWDIKEEYEEVIKNQIKTMDTIIDWNKYCFTMDPDRSHAVRFAFVELYKKNLIYRAERFVYWDPMLHTACSDLEVEFKNQKGRFFYINYKLVDSDGFITVATTRPETMFGDVALCVNPANQEYKHLIGSYAYVPIINRKIPIIGDESIELDKGTGVLKITPAHAALDYEIGKKYNLEIISTVDKYGKLCNVPAEFEGLSVSVGKDKIAQALDFLGQLVKVEEIEHAVPYGEKSGCELEYMVTKQWFVDAAKLAPKALEVVHNKKIKLIPEYFINTYDHWLNEIQPWCISRQIAWGHRLPVWYAKDGQIFVGMDEEDVRKQAGNIDLQQDSDVLDTWFSSALWPFAVQGYPAQAYQLPTTFLVTGRDILFFWVTRMIMMTLELCDQIPFSQVYLHGLVLDKQGKKMSKVVGNVVDPLALIEKYNSDILKIGLVKKSLPGKDVKFTENELELARNFLTKMQNAFDFCRARKVNEFIDMHPWSNWIVNQCYKMESLYDELMEQWELAAAIQEVEKFARDKFCAWFLEASKFIDHSSINAALHYVANRINQMISAYAPLFASKQVFEDVTCAEDGGFDSVLTEQAYIEKARSVLKMQFMKNIGVEDDKLDLVFLSKMSKAEFSLSKTDIAYAFNQGKIFLTLQPLSDLDALKIRLQKEILDHDKIIDQAKSRLNNKQFIENADQDLVDEMNERVQQYCLLKDEKQSLLSVL